MSTLTSNANSNNNNLIITSPATSSSSSNNNNCNAINNNNNPGTPNQSQNQQHQSALASGVSSAKRLLPFARSMSSSSNGGAGVAPGGTGSTGGIPAELNVVLHGYHRKLKTNKKKYFVVYDDLPNKSARLEYFDSEKKFKQSWVKNSSVHAKRSIILRNCFNINKGHDPKKHVIALYTRDDCFSIVFDSEEELNRWLRTLWSLQRGEEGAEGEPPRPTFEHVWDVFVQRKGLGDSYGILGNYRLCITDKTLSLVRIGPPTTVNGDSRVEQVEFSLAAIRRCGASQRYFYLEVGRSTKTGAGEIWMEAQDAMIAHNMHTTIMKSAKNKDCDSLGPMRNRSSSANAASKPTQMLVRRQTHTGQKPINCSPSGGAAIARERCDSLPSRNRTSSETSTVAGTTQQQQQQQQLHLNSGGMPPPRTIPSASAFHQRPHSMVMVQNRQSHSHSPPVHSSPLSPPSTGACSTGSDGSSLSIDETDSFVDPLTPDEGNGFPKVINPLSSGCSIPEENSDEYIHNYGRINQRLFGQHRSIEEFGSHAVRRGSPAPPGGHHSQLHHNLQQQQQQHHHHHQQQQHTPQMSGSVEGNYMDMCSPCGSSPGDPSGNGGYIPMSPVADYPRGLYTGSSSAHSRASSLAEDVPDGYVPMAPGGTVVVATTTASSASTSAAPEESYVDMEPTSIRSSSTHVPTPGIPTPSAGNGNISSAASSCSITSGTPSTDMRFSAYHLEKVEARFTPSEDDEMDRPLRTYSVGSRLEHNKRKLRVDMLSSAVESGGAGGNSRVRAFSVGSRAKVPRSELYKGSGGAPITAPLLSAGSSGSMQESASGSGSITNTSTIGGMVGSGSSSSVGKAGASGTSTTSGKKSISAPVLVSSKPHGSFDPMDDLMEIDFGASYHGGEPESSTPQKGMGMEDYMEMGAVGGAANTAIDTGYMEMKPGHLAPVPLEESDYLDMKPGCYEPNLSTKSTSSPITINSPKKFNGGGGAGGSNNNNYLEMSPRGAGPSSLSSSSQTQRKVPSDDYLNINPLMVGGGSGGGAGTGGDSGNEDKMTHDEDELLVAPSSAPEGYMEMSWNQNKSSLGAKVEPAVSDEYINMDFTRKELPESRLSSQPIAIQSGGLRVVGDLMMEPKMGGAPSNIPNYLPLNPAQQRHGSAQIGFSPRSRCDSRDSGIVTPSGSQATIFPFSPGSPIKPFVQADPDKCLIDGTSGTLLITELDEHSEESNESRVEDLSHNYAELSLQQPHTSNLKTEKSRPSSFKRTCTTTTTCTSTRTSASVVTTVKSAAVEYPDYVNCSPVTTPVTPKPTSTPMAVGDDQAGDYAIMNPAATATLRKLSSTSSQSELATPCPNNPTTSSSTSDVGLPPLLGKKSSTIGFRPITSSQDDALLRKTASGVSPKPAFARQFSERRPTGTDASGYELLQRSASSRPNSVNSEKIGCGTAVTKCPPSAGSTRPNSANSDRLPVVISATSSSASSTSTLCESKNQSPMASTATLTDQPIVSRPPSVSSERELHYASLDLPPCGTNPPPTAAASTRMDVDPAPSEAPTPDSLNSSPSPNSGCTSQQPQPQQGAFTYAQIDFDRTGAPIPPKAATGGQP